MWLYATKRTHILLAPIDPPSRRAGVILLAFPGVAYLIAYLVAESTPTLAIVIYRARARPVLPHDLDLRSSAPESSVTEEFT
jgi:hypothetical protein